MLIPEFSAVWAAFPDHQVFPTMGDLYRELGGGAEAALAWDGFGENGNTCASRMSVALNSAGFKIDPGTASAAGVTTLRDQAGNHIIFRIRELRDYLTYAYGIPDIDDTPPFDDEFRDRRGIVIFSVQGWSDASGHAALYDGQQFREEEHDDVPQCYPDVTVVRTEFWELR